MKEENRKYDLDDRLIDFAVAVIESILNYGEARGGESKIDFIHKMKVCLKELRESYNCLRILHRAKIYKDEKLTIDLIGECNELISIFFKSILTASEK